ncbi:MAG: D-glycerate 2-kinase [Anaerolineales bacterium]|nr:D-glycerate 2-kinase [Anaerolineales bacterium]
MQPHNFLTRSIAAHPRRASVTRILHAALRAADAGRAVKRYLRAQPLPKAKRIFAFGLGKASAAMTSALAQTTRLADALVITKHASHLDGLAGAVVAGNHPIPGADSLAAGRAARRFLARLTADDLLLCLLSGGGSALMADPVIALEELQALTASLLASGATIQQVNTVRRHLDWLKGGGVIQRANEARVISLILSDVVGDSLETIVSGPTAPDPTTNADAAEIARRALPFRETPKPGDPIFARVENRIIANNRMVLEAAQRQARREGFLAEIIERELTGEARDAGKSLAESLVLATRRLLRPFCLIAGGETTVTVRGTGQGGRNQEFALAAVDILRDINKVMLVSMATDGEDGPTDAAGAVTTGETAARAESLAMAAPAFLSTNDAYAYFKNLGDLIRIGPSGTNVNDLVLLFGF